MPPWCPNLLVGRFGVDLVCVSVYRRTRRVGGRGALWPPNFANNKQIERNSGRIRANISGALFFSPFSPFFPFLACLSKYIVENFRTACMHPYADTGIEDRKPPPPPPPPLSKVFRAGADSGMDSAIRAKHAKNVCALSQTDQVPYYAYARGGGGGYFHYTAYWVGL